MRGVNATGRLRRHGVNDSLSLSGAEGEMAHRRIWQEAFRFCARAERQTSLDGLLTLTGCPHAELVFSRLYPPRRASRPRRRLRSSRRYCLPPNTNLSIAVFSRDEATSWHIPLYTLGANLPCMGSTGATVICAFARTDIWRAPLRYTGGQRRHRRAYSRMTTSDHKREEFHFKRPGRSETSF